MKIYIDGIQKAELPTDNTKHKCFNEVIQMFIQTDWKEFKLTRGEEECLEKPICAKNADTSTPAKVK